MADKSRTQRERELAAQLERSSAAGARELRKSYPNAADALESLGAVTHALAHKTRGWLPVAAHRFFHKGKRVQ